MRPQTRAAKSDDGLYLKPRLKSPCFDHERGQVNLWPDSPNPAFWPTASAHSACGALDIESPILVYNAPFEAGRMHELAIIFPDLAPVPTSAIYRIVNMLPIARQRYYHPAMRGSSSINAVLPAIAPDPAYHDSEVVGGGYGRLCRKSCIWK